MIIFKIIFFLFILKIGHYHALTIEESRKILNLHYNRTQQFEIKNTNQTVLFNEDINDQNYENSNQTSIDKTSTDIDIVTNKNVENVTIPQDNVDEMEEIDNTKTKYTLSEELSPMPKKKVDDDKNTIINLLYGSKAKEKDEKESPTIFEELFIDTLTKNLNKKKEKFFDSNFGDVSIEESFQTLGRLCHKFLQHYRYFCVEQPITIQNEMRCRGYQQDCSHFFRPKSPLQRITEKLQSNIRLGYYKLYDVQKTMSPFI
ncbi:Hypothetical protein SRAE_X000081900 [Strongyloides ratti]|uniref:Uncharacterized protein n=1 Tax=Strongyloides ratti TaxID=34506 RepID=A0A090LV12_STRRB|nr:Hypothetical protein SRAE_X000081900 [Strongyloides ratti]CEF71494.1 Hypothetical protein SRAE_X000081900 [Strongyloides ratti]